MSHEMNIGRLAPVALIVAVFSGCSIHGPQTATTGESVLGPHHVVDVQANVFTSSGQENVALDFTPRGNVIVAWDSRRQQSGRYGVYARLLAGDGAPLSDEVQVNEYTAGSQSDPAVAVLPDGGAWIVWNSFGQDGDGGSIVARRFDAALRPVAPEIGVNRAPAGNQHDPAVAVDQSGRALVVWTSPDRDGKGTEIRGRLISRDGATLSDEFTLSDGSPGRNTLPAVAADRDDGFVVVWADSSGADARSYIVARRIDEDGSMRERFAVSDPDGLDHIEPAVAVDTRGRMIVTWLASPPQDDYRVVARRFDKTGAALETTRTISSPEAGWVSGASVAIGPGGRYLIAYNRSESANSDDLDLVARVFDANGEPVGGPLFVPRATAGDQQLQIAKNARRVVWNGSNQLAFGWSGDAGLGDDSAANVTLFVPEGLVIDETTPPVRVAQVTDGSIAPIPPLWDPDFKPLPPLLIPPGPNGFPGVSFTGWTPPDPEIAVGPDHLVMMTNGAIAFFDKTGNLLFEDEIEGGQGFWGAQGAGGFVFDPETLYDPHSGRFFAMAAERFAGRSFYVLAVSDDSNPLGTWHKYRIDVTNVDTDIDSPNMAVDQDVLYLSADFFGPDKYQVLMIEKAPLLSGGAINSEEIVIIGSGDQSMGMPIIYDTSAPAAYLIQHSEGRANGITFSEVRFHAIQNPLNNPTRVTVDLTVPTYAYPVRPPQRGTSNRPILFEPRFWSAMYVSGSLWAVHHIGPTRTRARWYEFTMNGWPDSGDSPTLRQWGEIDPDPANQVHIYFPSIAADTQGNAAMIFSRSSPTEFISVGGAIRRHSDPLNTFRPMEILKESTSPYNIARWGDYSHVEPEPGQIGSFWGAHEWTDVSNAWRTWIAPFDAGPPAFATLTDLAVLDGTLISGGLPQLAESDDDVLEVEARVTAEVHQPHLLRLLIGATTDVESPASIELTVESRITEVEGTVWLFLRNWNNDRSVRIGRYRIGMTEETRTFSVDNAGRFVRDSDGRIELEVKEVVFFPFALAGFHAHFDQITIGVD